MEKDGELVGLITAMDPRLAATFTRVKSDNRYGKTVSREEESTYIVHNLSVHLGKHAELKKKFYDGSLWR